MRSFTRKLLQRPRPDPILAGWGGEDSRHFVQKPPRPPNTAPHCPPRPRTAEAGMLPCCRAASPSARLSLCPPPHPPLSPPGPRSSRASSQPPHLAEALAPVAFLRPRGCAVDPRGPPRRGIGESAEADVMACCPRGAVSRERPRARGVFLVARLQATSAEAYEWAAILPVATDPSQQLELMAAHTDFSGDWGGHGFRARGRW